MAKVYVLGAGASKGLHNGMLSMESLNRTVGELVWNSNQGIFPNIKQFVLTSLPHIVDAKLFQLEIVLTELDNMANNKQHLGVYTKAQVDELRAYLLFAINEAMSQSIENFNTSIENWYAIYENHILRFLNSMGDRDAIVTLNYDTILDGRINYALFHQDVFRLINDIPDAIDHTNYGFDARYRIVHNQTPEPYKSFSYVPMYKLHGSFNWLYCSNCRHIDVVIVNPKGKRLMPYGADSRSLGICPDCQNKYEPVIITPTLLKDYANPYLKLIWQKAEEKLRHADDVVFIRYSLPDADKDLCDMFVRAIQSNHSLNGKKPSITVVDYAPNDSRPTDVEQRYTDRFGAVNYLVNGFSDYIENL